MARRRRAAYLASCPSRRRTGGDGDRRARAARFLPRLRGALLATHCGDVPVLATGGLAEVLSTLHETLTWRDDYLERSWRSGECSFDGHGVQLLPSALWTGPPLFCDHPPQFGGNALIYPARPVVTDHDLNPSRNLAGLLGHTRAAVLRALRTPRSTAELAACVGTSVPSASEHATALRAAGLVHTVRRGRGVNHSLTPLGRSLLNGNLNAH